ncbi:MAG TPA: Sir2 family NAD-dependent protein deacetylase [Chitinophagaceae bacterium]|nr:Sir2 family NAD-dependent protein deacetylase [Chitinophagaceae bacterium]
MKNLVVLTGAGISAESGLKTFRDSDGLWNGYNVYEVATPEGYRKNPKLVLDFYNMRRREAARALPNAAHKGIADLQQHYHVTVITQNIDDLHERAGSENVVHLHGEIFKMRGERDMNAFYEIRGDINIGDIAPDKTQFRPHVVWFNEPVPMIEIAGAMMSEADIFILAGTSLQVYPAAGLIDFLPDGIPKYIIDKDPPYISPHHNFHVIKATATEGMRRVVRELISH